MWSKQAKFIYKPAKHMCYTSAKGKTKATELLPEEDVWFWDRRIGGEEGDDGVA